MGQFDLYTLCSQTFWVLIKFWVFYFFFLNTYILELGRTLKMRHKIYKEINLVGGQHTLVTNPFLTFFIG